MRQFSFLGTALFAGLAVVVSSAAAQSGGQRLPPPRFISNPGWFTVTTGVTDSAQLPPQLFAINVRTDVGALEPFDVFNGLKKLEPNGAIIWATTLRRGSFARPLKTTRWPPRLADFRVDHGWEGQPLRRIQQRLLGLTTHGWSIDVRVYFGTQRPAKSLLASVQAELNRLRLPVR